MTAIKMSFRWIARQLSLRYTLTNCLVAAILVSVIAQQQASCWRLADDDDHHRQQHHYKYAAQYKRSQKNLRPLEIDQAGWRSISMPIVRAPRKMLLQNDAINQTADVSVVTATLSTPLKPTQATLFNKNDNIKTTAKSGKLIEWDDDELNDADLTLSNQMRDNFLEDTNRARSSAKSINSLAVDESEKTRERTSIKRQPQILTNRLVYHGQLRGNNTRVKLGEKLELDIDTHKPVGINRRSFGLSLDNRASSLRMASFESELITTTTSKPKLDQLEQDIYTTPSPTFKPKSSQSKKTRRPNHKDMWNSLLSDDTSSASSDWRPIVLSSRMRRSGKTHRQEHLSPSFSISSSSSSDALDEESLKSVPFDHKWKPITRGSRESVLEASKSKKSAPLKESIHLDGFSHKLESRFANRKIEEPFDNEEERTELGDDRDTRRGKSSSEADSQSDQDSMENESPIKWKPLDTSTPNDLLVASSTTTAMSAVRETTTTISPRSPETTTSAPTSLNNTETAQRSASDVNYIYSSQPQPQQQAAFGNIQTSGSSYYSNYLVPQQPQPQPVEQPQVVIDNTSGQTPEMIAERTPDLANPASQNDYYSVPQTVSAFQPATAPPSRAPTPTYYSNNIYAPDTSYGSSSAGVSSFRSQMQLAPQPIRQLAPSPAPVVRQEHHYHYYNQQPQAPPERAQPFPIQQQQQQQQPQQQQQQPTIIRELQPIMISQPVIQQQQQQPVVSSTTAAPTVQTQVIREIVREVPMQPQTIQMPTRMVMPEVLQLAAMAPQPPPPALPSLIRDSSFDSYGSYAAPAKRLMRQLSNSMPQVAIRMPSMPQFRVPVPAIQLPPTQPLRAASSSYMAPVTRQTGSFIIPPMPKKTTTLLTETQAMPTHTTIMQTTQFTPATRTTVYTTDHQVESNRAASSSYK